MSDHSDDILDGLEARLQSHAKSLESLLALTPARDYYGSQMVDGQDPSEQWNRKKQTKEQKAAAKKAKLDPANQKSALDIMKEQERKRKRELGIDAGDNDVENGLDVDELNDEPSKKKQKNDTTLEDEEARRKTKADKRKEKRREKAEKAARKKEKQEQKKLARQARELGDLDAQSPRDASAGGPDIEDVDASPEPTDQKDLEKLDISGLAASDGEDRQSAVSSVPSSRPVDSPHFDVSANHSTASSSSSIIPPSTASDVDKTSLHPSSTKEQTSALEASTAPASLSKIQTSAQQEELRDLPSSTSSPKSSLPKIDQKALQERLRARIEELRASRKADGPDGKPARSRQELLEQRRKKEEQRKAHKKELRRKQKEEEARKQEERLEGSGSPLHSSDIFSPKPRENNFSFGRLAFADGTAPNASLTSLQDLKKRKGPQDVKTALLAAENKEKRITALDAEKRADIAEKDSWLNAKKRIHGERVRDDTSLLKKALKRKEKQKTKSEKEWKDREEAVVKGKEAKQRKRETNLQKRREEKGAKKGGKKGGVKGKKKGRPGFEGRFKA